MGYRVAEGGLWSGRQVRGGRVKVATQRENCRKGMFVVPACAWWIKKVEIEYGQARHCELKSQDLWIAERVHPHPNNQDNESSGV
jgi:hypothetical protein